MDGKQDKPSQQTAEPAAVQQKPDNQKDIKTADNQKNTKTTEKLNSPKKSGGSTSEAEIPRHILESTMISPKQVSLRKSKFDGGYRDAVIEFYSTPIEPVQKKPEQNTPSRHITGFGKPIEPVQKYHEQDSYLHNIIGFGKTTLPGGFANAFSQSNPPKSVNNDANSNSTAQKNNVNTTNSQLNSKTNSQSNSKTNSETVYRSGFQDLHRVNGTNNGPSVNEILGDTHHTPAYINRPSKNHPDFYAPDMSEFPLPGQSEPFPEIGSVMKVRGPHFPEIAPGARGFPIFPPDIGAEPYAPQLPPPGLEEPIYKGNEPFNSPFPTNDKNFDPFGMYPKFDLKKQTDKKQAPEKKPDFMKFDKK